MKNFNLTYLKTYLLLVLFLSFNNLFSYDYYRESIAPNIVLTGQNFSNALIVQDEEITMSNYRAITNTTFVELYVEDFILPFYWYTAVVKLNVEPLLDNGTYGPAYPIQLRVENNRYGGFGNFVDLNKHQVLGNSTRGARVSILDISIFNNDSGQPMNDVPYNLKLKASFQSERYYQLNTGTVPSLSINQNGATNSIDFTWNSIVGAEEYELEWTWVDNYDSSSLAAIKSANQINFSLNDFTINNSRIRTKQLNYSISNIYDRGYLIYRIRTIGKFIDSGLSNEDVISNSLYGNWSVMNSASSSNNNTTVASWAPYYIQLQGHQNKLNWQFQSSFAENGKKKEVVSYFDGSLRNRQTVTKINTNQKTIVGEVIYDHEGRPAIEVLPVPINSNAIKYYPNLNKNINGAVYSYKDFMPLDSLYCTIPTVGMSTQSGASHYYSEASASQNNFQDFVPKANNYPFSQIVYSNDNTGRIKSKGGVGATHQIGSGHEMKYFYSVPAQEELNRLFGYYVGNAQHYKKNTVIDPNGQLSVSYLDPQGRTIATALAGRNPESTISLDDPHADRENFFEDLLNKLNSNDVDTDLDNNIKFKTGNFGNLFDGLRYGAQKVYTGENLYNFNYSLANNALFNFGCDSDSNNPSLQINYPFVYKLKIDIKNDCGVSQLANPINQSFGSYEVNDLNEVISTSNPGTLTLNLPITPAVGNYSISKSLVVDDQALEIFANDFVEKAKDNGCLFQFQQPQLGNIGCFTSCAECATYYNSIIYTGSNNITYPAGKTSYTQELLDANSELSLLTPGTTEYDILKGILIERYNTEFDLIIQGCMQPCSGSGVVIGNTPPTTSIACLGRFNEIASDVSPGGQYANDINLYESNTVNQSATLPDIDELPLSVFNTSNINTLVARVAGLPVNSSQAGLMLNNWRNPNYYDKNGLGITDLNHYYDDSGEIAYVTVIDLGNNNYNPEVMDGIVVTDNKIEPQYLKNVEDFINLYQTQSSWALSLVKYHPEFHYMHYQLQYCSANYTKQISLNINQAPTDPNPEMYTVNSDGYNSLIGQVATFEQAFNAGFFTSQTSLLELDPFFVKVHPLDGVITIPSNGFFVQTLASPTVLEEYRKVKFSMMEQALAKTNNSGFINTNFQNGFAPGITIVEPNVTIAKFAYELIRCTGYGGNCDSGTLNFTQIINKVQNDFDSDERDRFWKIYLSSYISLKQRIQDVFIHLYAARNGAYNDCIGNANGANISLITSGIAERYSSQKLFVDSQLVGVPNINSCSVNSQPLASKVKRFMMQEAMATNGGSISTAQANTSFYSQTGICPMVRDLEILLDQSAKNQNFSNIYKGLPLATNHPNINFITPALLTEMGGSATSYNLLFSGSGTLSNSYKTVTLNFTQQGFTLKNIELTIPNSSNNSNLNWNTYFETNSWKIIKMSNLVFTTFANNIYNFKVLAKINSNGQIFEWVLDGRTAIRLSCSTGSPNDVAQGGNPIILEPLDDADCDKKEIFANGLKSVMSTLISSGTIFSPNQSVQLPQPLRTYFGLDTSNYTSNWKASNFVSGIPQHFMLEVIKNGTTLNTGIVLYKNSQSTVNASATAPINSIVIGNTDDFENVHTITINWGGNFFTGFIHRVTTNNPIKTKLYFTCCSPCGEYDFDADGIGDDGVFDRTSCDDCDSRINPYCQQPCNNPEDIDCDGILNGLDNCPNRKNTNQQNSDEDGYGDACDNCPLVTNQDQLDTDFDGVGNACDNCPNVLNPNQSDIDADDIGDVCESPNGCFIGNDKKDFESTFKVLLNEIVQIDNEIPFSSDASSLNSYQQFLTHYLMPNGNDSNRISHFLANKCGYSNNTFQIIFSYKKFSSNFPSLFRWRSQDNNHPIFELSIVNFNFLGEITEITDVQLLIPQSNTEAANPLAITYKYLNANTGVIETDTKSGILILRAKPTRFSQIYCSNNYKLCEFTTTSNNTSQARQQTNFTNSNRDAYSIQNTCPCVPRPPVPVACDEAYDSYMSFMTTTFGANNSATLHYQNKKTEFCGRNLQYLVSGYTFYIQTLGITSTTHPQYITIAQFGATGLNYGYDGYTTGGNGYNSAILAYQQHLAIPENSAVTWKDFIISYLINHPEICPPTPMIPSLSTFVPLPEETPCEQFNAAVADVYNMSNYNAYLESVKANFKRRYLEEALATAVENFDVSYADREYQYTLYYYDQAGNLIQTVAPKGVATLASSTNDLIDNHRIQSPDSENNILLPDHNFKTQYRYNSLNQLVWQLTPDGGETRFAYDKLGRIVASQNDKQRNAVVELNPSLNLQTAIANEENYVIKASRQASWSNSRGTSLTPLSVNSSVEHTIRIDETHPISSIENLVFGLSYTAGTNDWVDFGFYYGENGQFKLRQGNQDFGPVYTVINGDKMKIVRSNGIIKFYKNGSLLNQVNEDPIQSSNAMYADFGILAPGSRICEIKIANHTSSDFSYTRYDALGRIIEAGQFEISYVPAEIDDNGRLVNIITGVEIGVDATSDNYPYNISKNQVEVTKTLYDTYEPFNANDFLLPQHIRNTRNRVTAILTFDSHYQGKELAENDTAIFYNYDIHGNVDEMVQRIGPNIVTDEQFPNGILKRVNYEYDLISGNVNKVYFQKGYPNEDQFIHRYNYDADNRITSVETSRDAVIWEKDASYLYYEHGPLAKVVLGDKKVQGIDYAYTLQGWLKTVNSENLVANNKDMGSDGNYISKDAFGFSLSYFEGDYQARQPGSVLPHSVSPTNSSFTNANLYNGNIKRMITSVRGLKEEILPTQVNLYSYDQLNRIFGMTSFKANEVAGSITSVPSYKSDYKYDKNGNLLVLHRDAPKVLEGSSQESILPMDRFEYNYILNTNKLKSINDDVALSNNFTEDIDNQTNSNNYVYDEIGQLIQDKAENISKIIWRVDGKVKSVQKYDGRHTINFFYDGLGNRIAKQTIGRSREGTTSTYYSRDAQGNVLGVYQKYLSLFSNEEVFNNKLIEHHIYGSSRLGIQNYNEDKIPEYNYRLVGDKSYELSNHLGNVLNVISDRKLVNTRTRSIFIDTFDRTKNWESLNNAALEYTRFGELITTTADSIANTGISLPLNLEKDQTVMFNVKVKKLDNFPTAVPLSLEVRDKSDRTVLWSTLINEEVVSGSFTPVETDDYYVTITANCLNATAVRFSVDDFYAYTLDSSNSDFVSLFKPDVLAYNDYYPFGSLVPNRHASTDSYRYGFQGQEKDDELKGEGNSLNYTFRMHDPRVGRFFARDPLEKSYPWYTPYQFSGNKVIQFIELEGLEEAPSQAQMNEFMSGKKLDMNNAPSSSPTNAKGFSRNGIWFWKEALKQNPEMFNSSNKWRIENNIAPTVNDQWIKYNPSHAAYKGDKLIHHHINQGRFAVGIPEKVHRTFFKELHNRASSWFKANKVKSTGNTFMLVFSSVDIIKAADKNPDTMMSTFDPKAPLNTLRGLTPSDPIEWLFNGNSYYEITKKNKDGSFNVNFYAEFYSENGKYRGRNKIEDGVIKKNKDGYIYTPTPEFN